jgi:hypothetical protein
MEGFFCDYRDDEFLSFFYALVELYTGYVRAIYGVWWEYDPS